MIAACQDRYHAGITEGPVQETHAYKQRHECLNSCGVSLSKFGARGGRGGGRGVICSHALAVLPEGQS